MVHDQNLKEYYIAILQINDIHYIKDNYRSLVENFFLQRYRDRLIKTMGHTGNIYEISEH